MENVKHITLTLTEACNLRCVYCYEAYKNTRNMTFEKAVEILDTELNADDEFDYVEIAFHGGEPLLEYELLHNICEYVWAHTARPLCSNDGRIWKYICNRCKKVFVP